MGYVVWLASGCLFGVAAGIEEDAASPQVRALLAAVGSGICGAMTIVFSRPFAYGRDSVPWVLRIFLEGWRGALDYAPWFFRLMGSGLLGIAVGCLVWAASSSLVAAFIVGAIAALGIWLWTWFVFPETEE